MSENTYTLFEKIYFWKWVNWRSSSGIGGGQETIFPNRWDVPKCRRKWGGLMRRRRPREKGHPPQPVFGTFPKFLE